MNHTMFAVVASNQPTIFTRNVLGKALSVASSEQALSIAASLVSARQSHYFDQPDDTWDVLSKHINIMNPWNQYQMAVHALTNGEYDMASRMFQRCSCAIADKNKYLWIETLDKISQAEKILCKEAALGIPSAGVLLHDAITYLDGLQTRQKSEDFSFQIRFLLLRLDILDLVTVLRQILREMRLVNEHPAKGTRTFSHVPSIFRSFLRLAKQFTDLDQRYGLLWQSRRTPACLLSFRDLAFFLAQTTKAAFGPILPSALMKINIPKLSSKLVFPMSHLISELNGLVVQPFIKAGNSIDAKTISTALLQVLDGILLVPIPLPRDFCAPLPVVELEWTIRPDATHAAEMNQSSFDVIESFPSVSPLVCITGNIVNVTKIRKPLRGVMLWYQIKHIGPLEEEGGSNEAVPLPPMPPAIHVPVDRRGKFQTSLTLLPLHLEGWFTVETFLKCQTVDGRMYSVAVSQTSAPRIRIRNARSR